MTQFVVTSAPPKFLERIETKFVGTNESLETEKLDLGWEKNGDVWEYVGAEEEELYLSPTWTTSVLRKDDLSGNEFGLKQRVVLELLRADLFAELDDSTFCFDDHEQVKRIMTDLKLVAGKASPTTYNTDFNLQTDESFSRMFFYGIAAPLIAKQKEVTDSKYGPYVVDMEFMIDLEYRSDKYKKYGATVYFDKMGIVSAIHDSDTDKLVLRGQPGWEEAKMQAKVSAFTLVTVREHLSQTHLIVANNTSREIVKNLSPDHPIRRLMAIFTYNTVSVNQNAANQLVPERCLIHRASPLTHKGMQQVFDHSKADSITYQPFPNRTIANPTLRKLEKEGGFPYLTEGCEYYEIARDMVRDWLERAGDAATDESALKFYDAMKKTSEGQEYEFPEYSANNMVDMLATIVFAVTGYHELVGHVPDYTDYPNKAGFRISKSDPLQVDAQSFLLASVIAASTSLPAPELMKDFPNFIGVGANTDTWESDVWKTFQDHLKIQHEKVQSRHKKRDFEFIYFDPENFECSVSV